MRRLAIVAGLLVLAWLTLGRLAVPSPPLLSPGLAAASDVDAGTGDDDGGDRAGTAKDEKRDKDDEAAKDAPANGGPAEGPALPEGYAGDEACEACHEEAVAAVKRSPHGTAQTATWVGRGCEGCHGPGQEHVDDPTPTNIRGLRDTMPATERAAVCLACHAGSPHLRDVRGGEHLLAGVACAGCHEPHELGHGDAMLRKRETDLCMSCHLDVRASFAMPWRHGPREARIVCRDCHDPHGSRNPGMLKAPNDRTCLGCHTDVQGPWVFEHAALVADGCVSCHVPHGSANRQLLRFQQTATLCYQCHTLTPRTHVQPSYRDCTRCHVWVHGSNTDPRFLEP